LRRRRKKMGVMSRRVLPACSSLCYFCPSLRARSRQPVKRYKKIIAEIYQLPPDGEPNDRRIGKLCDYVSRNPTRIPKVTHFDLLSVFTRIVAQSVSLNSLD
jgi:hypothetical protein